MKKLLILGAGGYGKTILDVAEQLGCYEKIAFLDDNASGSNILGKCKEYPMFADEWTEIYPAFGNNEIRMQWLEHLEEEGIGIPTLVHPRSYVSPKATLGTGTMILPMAVVNTGVRVGNGCIVNIGALVEAENRIPEKSKIDSNRVVENREYPL